MTRPLSRGSSAALLVAGLLAASAVAAAPAAEPTAFAAPTVAAVATAFAAPTAAAPTAAAPTAAAPTAAAPIPAAPSRIRPAATSRVRPAATTPAAVVTAAAPAPVLAPVPAPAPPASAWLRKDPKPTAPALLTKEGPSPLRIGGMLLLVATLGGFAFYARRRRQARPPGQVKEQLRVLGSTRLGPKATAVVVDIGGKRLLLGVTEGSVQNLAWLDDEPPHAADERDASSARAIRAPLPSIPPEAAGPSGFLKILRSAVGSTAVRQVIPSDEVARSTRDEVSLSRESSRREVARREVARREREAAPDRDDDLIEGQVMGLVKRRKETL